MFNKGGTTFRIPQLTVCVVILKYNIILKLMYTLVLSKILRVRRRHRIISALSEIKTSLNMNIIDVGLWFDWKII